AASLAQHGDKSARAPACPPRADRGDGKRGGRPAVTVAHGSAGRQHRAADRSGLGRKAVRRAIAKIAGRRAVPHASKPRRAAAPRADRPWPGRQSPRALSWSTNPTIAPGRRCAVALPRPAGSPTSDGRTPVTERSTSGLSTAAPRPIVLT